MVMLKSPLFRSVNALVSLACVCVVLTADFSNVMALWLASDCEN